MRIGDELLRSPARRGGCWSAGVAVLSAVVSAHGQCPPSFAQSVAYSAGTESRGVATGDFNRDGRMDVAVANRHPSFGNVTILLGTAAGTLQWAGTCAAGLEPWAVAVADLNGDTRLDLAVANLNECVSILLGNGNGTFQPADNLPVPMELFRVAAGEINGDGKPDLVTTGFYNGGTDSVYVLLGNGDGTFQPAIGTPTTGTSQFWGIEIRDFNTDGKADLAVINEDANGVFILLGHGDGTFEGALLYPTGPEPVSLAAADFNADGNADLAVANYGLGPNPGRVAILLGNGNGTFQPATYVFPGSWDVVIAAADLNGDARPDLAVTHNPGTMSALIGNGDGTFQPPVAFAAPVGFARGIAVADIQGDGRIDVLTSFINGNCCPYQGNVGVFLNTSGCYPDCNQDCTLTVADFGCFQTRFAAQSPYADCNQDSVLTTADFGCFQTKFIVACP